MSYSLDNCSIALRSGTQLAHVATDISQQLAGARSILSDVMQGVDTPTGQSIDAALELITLANSLIQLFPQFLEGATA